MRRPRIITKLPLLSILGIFGWWLYFEGQNGRRFLQIHRGMSRAEVTNLIGPPLNVWTNAGGEDWNYSSLRFPGGRVRFDTNGLVSAAAMK